MQAFADLFDRLDSTTSTNLKVEALAEYFRKSPAADAAWAIYFLIGRQRKRVITSAFMKKAFAEASTLPEWILVESFAHVGDSSEAISLLLDQKAYLSPPELSEALVSELPSLSEWVEKEVLTLDTASEEEKKKQLWRWWQSFPSKVTFVANKLLTGSFRVGVSKRLVIRGLAKAIEVDESDLTYRLSGHWDPSADFFESLSEESHREDISRPYPFYLAYPLDDPQATLGEDTAAWWAEWKWDGIRCQAIHREGHVFLWSRGEDMINNSFPELTAALRIFPPGTVIDAELLAWRDNKPLPFSELQTRLGRLKPSKKVMEQAPTVLMAYDLLEFKGEDLRQCPLTERRRLLEALIKSHPHPRIKLSQQVKFSNLQELEELRTNSREVLTEGLMLKKKDSVYREGRRRGDWWKYKVAPFTLDAVLIYAQAGSGRRSNLFTDYTFAVWKEDELLPVAKAYSGLTDEEIRELDRWIRRNTRNKFGPVRAVEPKQVFELAFENIAASKRHKSGIAVRFPRILRWRKDKAANEADRIEELERLL